MAILAKYFTNLGEIFFELSPWVVLGLFLAGLLHVLLPAGFIKRHLGGSHFWNVFKAVAVGIPMPLCSCGVIPTAIGLRRDGASRGAAMGFLISTPQTGVDSILVTAGFLGWPLALFKVACALISGVLGGILVNGGSSKLNTDKITDNGGPARQQARSSLSRRWPEIFTFGFGRLFRDIYIWLLIGVGVAALITTFVPADYLVSLPWSQGIWGMLVVLAVSIPMYVCSTSSVPLAAALVAIGASPGAALVFLVAGPTTNIATVGMVYRVFGFRSLFIYLATVIVMSIAAGLLFDGLLAGSGGSVGTMVHLPGWLTVPASFAILALTTWYIFAGVWVSFRSRSKSASGSSENVCCGGLEDPGKGGDPGGSWSSGTCSCRSSVGAESEKIHCCH